MSLKFRPIKSVYPAHSKHSFYFRAHISGYILKKGFLPLNPFMIFDYFLTDTVKRDTVRNANNNLVKIADEIWIFGPISDGVLAEILLAKKSHKKIKYFEIIKSKQIKEIPKTKVAFESGLDKYCSKL